MSLIVELKRRNVFRVAAAYLVVGWLLTEVLTTILPTLGAPEWTSRAVILIFAFGFIPAVVLSWVYEVTPDGIKRETEVVRDESITDSTAKKLDYVTIAAVIGIIIFVAAFSAKQAEDEASPADRVMVERELISDASVAVLPFVNMSNDEDNEYFSDGLTETLLHMLAQVPDLKVAARTSSFSFKNQKQDYSGNRRVAAGGTCVGRQRTTGWRSCTNYSEADSCRRWLSRVVRELRQNAG